MYSNARTHVKQNTKYVHRDSYSTDEYKIKKSWTVRSPTKSKLTSKSPKDPGS